MSPRTLKNWLGCAVLAWPFVAGCGSTQRVVTAPRHTEAPVVMASAPSNAIPVVHQQAGPIRQPTTVTYQSNGRTIQTVSYVQSPPAPESQSQVRMAVDPANGETIQVISSSEGPALDQGPAVALPSEGKTVRIIQHAPVVQKKIGAPKEDAGPRRTVVDITAGNHFAHAADYSWLQGQVEYSRIAQGWRLRYASVDEADIHGGSVILNGDGDLQQLRDGQVVRVCGRLCHSDDRKSAPPYRVESFEVLAGK